MFIVLLAIILLLIVIETAKITAYFLNMRTALSSGQFAPAWGGQFQPARGGQFSPASGGQFDRFLQSI